MQGSSPVQSLGSERVSNRGPLHEGDENKKMKQARARSSGLKNSRSIGSNWHERRDRVGLCGVCGDTSALGRNGAGETALGNNSEKNEV